MFIFALLARVVHRQRGSAPSLALSLGLFRTFKVSHKGLNVELVYRNFAKQRQSSSAFHNLLRILSIAGYRGHDIRIRSANILMRIFVPKLTYMNLN